MIEAMTLVNPLFWFFFMYFIISIFFAFYIPGEVLMRKMELTLFQRNVLAIVIGMVLWALQGFILGYLQLRWLSYFYLLIFFLLWINRHKSCFHFSLKRNRIIKTDWLMSALISIGMVMQLTIVWFTGFLYKDGVYACCGNPSDGLYHIALTNQLIKNVPPYEPGMAGVVVHNYHYLSNMVVAELVRVFHLPLIATQFQYSTVFTSLFLGLVIVVFGQVLRAGRAFTLWLLFFLYMGGDWMYLLLLTLGKGLNFNMSGIEDGLTFLINPPRAFSIVVFFAALSLLLIWLREKDFTSGLIMAVLFGSLVGFKVYTGIFVLIGLAAIGVYFLFSKKITELIPLCITVLLTLFIYLPVNTNAGGLFFTGWWLFENFIVQKNLGLVNLMLAKSTYEAHHSYLRVLQYELTFGLLYIFSVFGSKLLGIFQTRKSLAMLPKELHVFLIPAFIISAIAGFFFLQKSGGSNTFNFLVSIFIFGSIYTAMACTYWINKLPKIFRIVAVVLVIFLTVPRVAFEWTTNVVNLIKHNGFVVDNQQLEAARYLKDHSDSKSIVLVDNRQFDMEQSSPYLSIFTDRQMFLSGKGILDSHGVETLKRSQVADTILSDNTQLAKDLLQKNKIKYIYLSSNKKLAIENDTSIIIPLYKNSEVKILKIAY